MSELKRARWESLVSVKNTAAPILDALSFVWLILTIIDLSHGLTRSMDIAVTIIWVIFIIQFLIEFFIAPKKKVYLRHNIITMVSLFVPALRVLRLLRFTRLLRGASLVKIFGALSRGMKSLRKSLARKTLVYVISLTLIVIFTSAAGILSFEKDYSNYFTGYGSALWWSGMMVTTMGSDYFPKSPEGRVLGFSLAVYGFAIFGYVAASIASIFVSKTPSQETATSDELKALRLEMEELKSLILEIRKE